MSSTELGKEKVTGNNRNSSEAEQLSKPLHFELTSCLVRKTLMLLAIGVVVLGITLNVWAYVRNRRLEEKVSTYSEQAQRAQTRWQFLVYLHQELTALGKECEPVHTLLEKHKYTFSQFGISPQTTEAPAS